MDLEHELPSLPRLPLPPSPSLQVLLASAKAAAAALEPQPEDPKKAKKDGGAGAKPGGAAKGGAKGGKGGPVEEEVPEPDPRVVEGLVTQLVEGAKREVRRGEGGEGEEEGGEGRGELQCLEAVPSQEELGGRKGAVSANTNPGLQRRPVGGGRASPIARGGRIASGDPLLTNPPSPLP
jgi:hypothetical protein